MPRPALRLRAVRPEDESAVRTAQQMMAADDFVFALDLEPGTAWTDFLAHHARLEAGVDLPAGRVPASLLVAEVDGTIVGRTSLRYELNDWLRTRGGHVGYGVLPDHRRRGYATEILRQSVELLRARGVVDVLVTCDDDNAASAAVIERCGGVLDPLLPRVDLDDVPKRRYWIHG